MPIVFHEVSVDAQARDRQRAAEQAAESTSPPSPDPLDTRFARAVETLQRRAARRAARLRAT